MEADQLLAPGRVVRFRERLWRVDARTNGEFTATPLDGRDLRPRRFAAAVERVADGELPFPSADETTDATEQDLLLRAHQLALVHGSAPIVGLQRSRHLEYRGACLGCGWVAERTHRGAGGETAAVEDAHDHTHPGWRDIPVVGTPPSLETPARHARAVEQWRWLWESRLPDGWLARGGPIRTNRTPPGNRHVPGRAPGGGYDLASTTETAASLPERAGGQLGLF